MKRLTASRLALASALAALAPLSACRAPNQHLEATNAIGPYSAAVAAGEIVFLSGKIGDPTQPFAAEANGALDAVAADLARLGLGLDDAVSVTVYLVDMARFPELNELYAARLQKPFPARTTVAVAALPKGAHVEIQVVARRR